MSKRRSVDVRKLCSRGHCVVLVGDGDFYVKFCGPQDSPYANARYKVHVILPSNYPYKSPSIGFATPIFHPNVDEASGSVCLDVINQTWSPMYDLVAVFEVFLPQLLLYPNAADPLNRHAATLYNKDNESYVEHVKEHVSIHASRDFDLEAEIAAEQREHEEQLTDSPFSSSVSSPSSPPSPYIEASTSVEFDSPVSDQSINNDWMVIDDLDLNSDEGEMSDCDDFPVKAVLNNSLDALLEL